MTDKRIPNNVNKRLQDISNKNIILVVITISLNYHFLLNISNKYAISIRLDSNDALIHNYIDIIHKLSQYLLYKFDIGALCFHNGIYMKLLNRNMKSHSVGLALFINKETCNNDLVSIYFTLHNEMYKSL